MYTTTRIDGTTARITPHGEIDYDSLPPLRAAAAALPPVVTEVIWDLRDTHFMDVAGVHLLLEQQADPLRETSVTNLARQPLSLLGLAEEIAPGLGLARLRSTRDSGIAVR
ncbi:hypothetical protein ACFYY2_10250 [Streptomyces sp. NPDC001822]|uniref:hypothetical protein n=1 Tax=Streptomyces sp. NPDC001822 TaxID=3364614 RepID=UPI00368B552A